ncbi:hypothetical protein IFR05_007731 [Cadophora sp. M221]|nr:hypothetical protein IFR05_007731 [Cadophora sp. M221]
MTLGTGLLVEPGGWGMRDCLATPDGPAVTTLSTGVVIELCGSSVVTTLSTGLVADLCGCGIGVFFDSASPDRLFAAPLSAGLVVELGSGGYCGQQKPVIVASSGAWQYRISLDHSRAGLIEVRLCDATPYVSSSTHSSGCWR